MLVKEQSIKEFFEKYVVGGVREFGRIEERGPEMLTNEIFARRHPDLTDDTVHFEYEDCYRFSRDMVKVRAVYSVLIHDDITFKLTRQRIEQV